MYKILMIEKTKEECIGSYRKSIKALNTIMEHFKLENYDVTTVLELEQITDRVYSGQDCVLAHPTPKKMERIRTLHEKYPGVGLVLTCGGFCVDETPFIEFSRDSEGVIFLPKPFTIEQLDKSVNKAIEDSRKAH